MYTLRETKPANPKLASLIGNMKSVTKYLYSTFAKEIKMAE